MDLSWFENLPIGNELLIRIGESLLLIVVYFGLRVSAARVTLGIFRDAQWRFRVLKVLNLILTVFALIWLYQLWLNRSWSVASFVGLLSAGLAIVLREPLLNIAGWFFILTRRPFTLGDRVEIAGHGAGDVIDLGFNYITIMEINNWVAADQSTGRILHVPNSLVFTDSVANYGEGLPYVWNELEVPLTYESNWEKAKAILQSIVEEASPIDEKKEKLLRDELRKFDRYFISFQHLTPIVYVSRHEYGVLLTIRYLCEPRGRRTSENNLWSSIFRAFLSDDEIHFAYPTKRLFLVNSPEDG